LVRLEVDVIVAAGPTLPALHQATSTIPVVMASAGGDAVAQGFARTLGRPGENFTGISGHGVELMVKRLELLKELVPNAALVAVFWDRGSGLSRQAVDAAARERGWKLLSLEIRDVGDLEGAFKAASDARTGALLLGAGGILVRHARRVSELAAKHRLPAIYHLRLFADAGGLISYGTDVVDIWRRAATYVDKILKGAKPADLPIEQPAKFELVINLKAAKALGLTIPQPLLLRADEVIK
jgi:putative ABC transport system substrate-binding protein